MVVCNARRSAVNKDSPRPAVVTNLYNLEMAEAFRDSYWRAMGRDEDDYSSPRSQGSGVTRCTTLHRLQCDSHLCIPTHRCP